MELENEKLIERFLSGEMAEEERFDFEERFVSDADLFEEIKAVEDDLIEKYVRGWMNPATKAKFEKHFLTTNKRRERVEFSRQLINKIERQKEMPVKKNADLTAENVSIWDKFAVWFSTPKIAAAGALALIFAMIGSWFLYRNFQSETPEIVRNENTETLKTPTPTITPKPTVSPEISTDNAQQIPANNEETNSDKNINKPPEKSEAEVEKTPTPADTPLQKAVSNPVLALFAGTTRSEGKNQVLNLPKEAKAATLQLNLESEDYKTFQAELTDADGNVLFRQSNLKANKSKINFTIPAEKLKRGDYIIKLSGKLDAEENESVADFQFRVQQ